ncbi:MAG: alpha/beta hydrolase [Bacteroidales bacterium]|nr:alpha/beta hydrolase [Bacteroidales bacterium]
MKKIKITLLLTVLILTSLSLFAQEKYITTSDNVKLYINIKGEGTPCLFIHGGPGQGSNYWEKLAGDFCEKNFMMIYLDQRGCGRSTSPENNDYSLERMIKDFEEIRESLEIKDWMIMGHSFGGILQTGYAQKHPTKIDGILMFNCTLNLKESIEESYIPSIMDFYNIENTNDYTNNSIPLATRINSLQQLLAQKKDTWKLSFDSPEAQQKFGQTYAGFNAWNMDFMQTAFSIDEYNKDYSIITNKIETPILFVYGTEDKNIGENHYQKIKFPNMLLYSIEGGHMNFIDNKEPYINAINKFKSEFNFND